MCEYYETHININKIVKIQALFRMKYWFLPYIKSILQIIKCIYERKNKEYVHEPTIFGNNSKENIKLKEIEFKLTQEEMKEGDLAQTLIGNWIGWEDLKQGHSSGLDCRKKDNTIIIDVKNKWNTCNSGSQKTLFDKLSKYKKENPSTRCIWAIINEKPTPPKEMTNKDLKQLCKEKGIKKYSQKKKESLKDLLREIGMTDRDFMIEDNKKLSEKIMYNGVEIEKVQGIELFKLVFSIGNINYSTQIINIVQHFISNH